MEAVNFPRSDGVKFLRFAGGDAVVSLVVIGRRANVLVLKGSGCCAFDSCGASLWCGCSIFSSTFIGVVDLEKTYACSMPHDGLYLKNNMPMASFFMYAWTLFP